MLETTPISASSAAEVVRPTAERVGPIRRMFRSEWLLFLLFVGPNLLLFGVFTYWPMVYSGYLSLVTWDLLSPTKEWVGLENYRGLFTDDTFPRCCATPSSLRPERSADRWCSAC